MSFARRNGAHRMRMCAKTTGSRCHICAATAIAVYILPHYSCESFPLELELARLKRRPESIILVQLERLSMPHFTLVPFTYQHAHITGCQSMRACIAGSGGGGGGMHGFMPSPMTCPLCWWKISTRASHRPVRPDCCPP